MPSHLYVPRVSFHSDRKTQSQYRNGNVRPRSESPNQQISTRPSPAPWADTPFKLIQAPKKEMHVNGVFWVASEMAHVHNMLLRGLNSIVLQAPYIADSSTPEYEAEDVRDLLLYVRAWCRTLEHHHRAEETTFFPKIEQMTGVVDLMDELEEQHEEFEYGLAVLKNHVEKVVERPNHYRWATMKTMIASFAPALVHHLHDEIDFLLSMDTFNGEGLRRCWLETEKACCQVDDETMLYEILPFVLGNSDKSGGITFPTIPKHLQYGLKLWLKKKHRGAWRFNCCDFHGRPVPLQMLPENQDED